MEEIRIAVVGLGHRGRGMCRLTRHFAGVKVVAVCDIRPQNWYETQFGGSIPLSEEFPEVAFFESYDRLLEESNPNVVIVETGADIHCDFCCKALARDIHVFAEIPLVASLEEAERIYKAAKASKGILSVGANPNYQRFVEYLEKFHRKGLLGKPYYMEAEYIHSSDPEEDVSHLYENGDWRRLLVPIRYCTHSLGPLLKILHQPIRYVSCLGTGCNVPEEMHGFLKDDMQSAHFQTEDGTLVRIMRNGRCRAKIGHHNYRVFGTEGYIERMDRMGKPVIRYNSTKELENTLKEVDGRFMPMAYEHNPDAEAGHGGMDYAMMDQFLRHLRQGKPAISVEEGIAMTIPGIYAEASAKRNGRRLKVKYPWDGDWTTDFEVADD